jgi:diguanylate cyclase (GGDEF)-like protein
VDLLLRPGMRLMRRLAVSGKFGLIAVLLLLPLGISMVGAFQQSTGQITTTQREREGLKLVEPMVQLVVQLSTVRNQALKQQRPSGAWADLAAEVDSSDAAYGDELGTRPDWARARADVAAVYATGQTLPQMAAQASVATRHLQQVIKKVSDASNLILDPELDSYYVMIMIVDRLPRVVVAATEAQELMAEQSGGAADKLTLAIATSNLDDAGRQLSLDLATAVSASNGKALRQQISAESWAVGIAVNQFSAALSSTAGRRVVDTDTVCASALALSNALASGLDELLAARQDQVTGERSRPLQLTLVVLAVVLYLLMALTRATTRDVRLVLEEISTVTNGTVHQNSALSGSDEFAQMSRAVIFARDRLTALVGTLKFQASHDELTALGNRSLFTQKVEDALAAGSGTVVVLLVDLDGFKDVNDSFGHDIGDRLLRTVGARIHRGVPRRSVVARLGSDEFAVLVGDLHDGDTPEQTVTRLEQLLSQPVDLDGRRLRIQAGIGVARAEAGTAKAVELLRNADVALNFAKDRGKGRTTFFEPGMHEGTRERTELSADLVQAIDRDELRVVYQPIVDLQAGTLHGVEALVRWEHGSRGSIPPTVFVPLAEATGLIVPIGRWVLERACEQLAQWQRDFPDGYPLTMDVNLSTDQLTEKDLVAEVLALVERTGIDATALVLEITESSLVRDIDTALRRLGQLSAVGVRIALDDFGTGYSSLSYLRRLPVTVLKIDKSFVVDGDPQGQALLRSIVDLGTGQGMQIVAEGIEEPEQADRLRTAGCHLGQGYLWARPMTADGITAILGRGGRLASVPGQRGDPGMAACAPLGIERAQTLERPLER